MEHEATQLEKQHVHSVYESTAPYFNEVQSKAWPKVRQFLLEQEPGSLIVDIGCGTGKYLSVNSEIYNLGCDYCKPLVEIAKNNKHEVMVCDNLNLPFRDQCFDTVISIGVIHHFSTKQRRIQAIKEMARTLVPGGRIMLYVWAMEQKSRRFEKQDVFVPWNKALLPRRPSETNQPENKMNINHNDKLLDTTPKQIVGLERTEMINIGNCKQSHKTGNCISTESCCITFPNDESRLYSSIGRSLRSWFFSRSLDESALRRHLDKMKCLSQVGGWVNSPVSVQPSRHCSVDLGHERLFMKKHSFDDDVFIQNKPQNNTQWIIALNAGQNENGKFCELDPRDPKQVPKQVEETYSNYIGSNEDRQPTHCKLLKRTSTTESNDSILDETISVGEEENDQSDSKAFMRYYHVFREGELSSLLETDVPELQIASSCFDHGNWCIVAEKKNISNHDVQI
ncbi:probable tRNA methyltransferase 9B [Xenopus laevis]|uniref:Probable tRNA methyltransferase 9B n=2 Tax=Xenopus laevis TaxID=8355 RepID=A0A1L8HTT2_XENLA|nr:probable tRNA methyltransferase 9B [Xenopus laevis]OCT99526.1 hypothetical protein XELAEV_18005308mg [Xenopus laevis]